MPEPTDIVTYAETGDIEAAKKLLDWADAESVLSRGAVLELRDPLMSRTAIHRAAEFGHAKFVKVRSASLAGKRRVFRYPAPASIKPEP